MKDMAIEFNRGGREIAHTEAYPNRDRARGQALVVPLEEDQAIQVDLFSPMIITQREGKRTINSRGG